ncbi:hypothetical protein D9M69_567920 [compost metagenome]
MLLPEPDGPTTATVLPAGISKLMPCRISRAGSYEKRTFSNFTAGAPSSTRSCAPGSSAISRSFSISTNILSRSVRLCLISR